MEKPRPTKAQLEILERWSDGHLYWDGEPIESLAKERTIAFCPDCSVPVWLTRMADYGLGNQEAGIYSAAFQIAGILGGDRWLECETCFGK